MFGAQFSGRPYTPLGLGAEKQTFEDDRAQSWLANTQLVLRFNLTRERAFTLIELLVVILIIGILIAVAAPSFIGQINKANDSVALQNLNTAYESGKAAAWTPLSSYPYIGDPAPDPGSPSDFVGSQTSGSPTLFGYLNSAEPALTFADGYSPTDPSQIAVQEPNPQKVIYMDQSASGTVFCLVDVEQSNYNGDGEPAGLTYLSGTPSAPCNAAVPGFPSPPTTTTSSSSSSTSTSSTSTSSTSTSSTSTSSTSTSSTSTTGAAGGPGGSTCPSGEYQNTNDGSCQIMVTLTSGWSPNIGDVILNEINFGETPYASGHAYLSADINGHNRAGNYAFQISTTSNFTHATTVAVTSSHSTLDVANGFRDYHVDITLTDYQVGTLYWRATAIDTADGASPNDPGGYRTTSKTASFTNNSGPPAFASNPQDVGATGGDSAASNSGFGSGPSSAPPSSDPSTIIGSPTDVAAAACLLYAGSALDTPGTCSADALYSAEQSGELSATSAGNNFGLQMDRLRAATNLTQAVCDSYDSGNTGSPTPYMTDVTLGSNSSFAWSFPNGDYLVMGNLPTGLDLSTTSEPAYSWDLNGYNVATHQDLTCNPVGASYNYYGFPQGTWGYWYGAYYENGTATTGCPNVVGGASYSYTGVANGPNDGLLSADAQTTSSGQTAYCLSPNPGNPFYSNWQFNSATKPVIDQQYLASSHFSFTNTHTPPPAGVPVLAVTTNPSVPTTFGPNLFYILNGYVDSSVPTVSANLVTQLETGNYPDVVEFLNWKLGTGGSPFS